MPIFELWVIDHNHKTRHLKIFGDTKRVLIEHLKSYPFKILNCTLKWSSIGVTFTNSQRQVFCHDLSLLLKANISLVEALQSMLNDPYDKNIKALLSIILLQVEYGHFIRPEFCQKFFDPIFSFHISQAQHVSSLKKSLGDVLENLAQYYARKIKLIREIQEIIRYPTLIFMALLMLFYTLNIFIMPNLVLMIPPDKQGFAFNSLLWFLKYSEYLGLFVILMMTILFINRSKFMAIPWIHRLTLSAFWLNLAFCLENDISLMDALALSIQSQNKENQKKLTHVLNAIQEGNTVTKSFEKISTLPKSILILLKISSRTDDIKTSILKINDVEQNYRIKIIQRIIFWTQPILLCLTAVILIWILCATILPMYTSFEMVSP